MASPGFIHRPQCELCGSPQTQSLLKKPFTDPAIWDFLQQYYERRVEKQLLAEDCYEILKCRKCGFIWQAFILNDEGMSKLYDRWISPETSLRKKHDIAASAGYRRQVESIVRLWRGKVPEDIQVLDFGMGWGYWCLAAKACGYQVVGLDISETRLDFAREQGIQAMKGFAELADQQFDFINAEQVLEHTPQPRQMLCELLHHLKPDGVIRIAVPNGQKVEQELTHPNWHATKNAIHPLEHINCFRHKTLIDLGKQAGLSVILQPFLPTMRYGWRSAAKNLAARYYRRFFGTTLYFRCGD